MSQSPFSCCSFKVAFLLRNKIRNQIFLFIEIANVKKNVLILSHDVDNICMVTLNSRGDKRLNCSNREENMKLGIKPLQYVHFKIERGARSDRRQQHGGMKCNIIEMKQFSYVSKELLLFNKFKSWIYKSVPLKLFQ